MKKSLSASRIYTRDFLIAMAAYVIVLIIAISLINLSPASAWWRIPLAIVPIIPILFAMRVFIRFLTHMDELQRRIQLEALAFGFAGSGILTFTYGFLENVGFPHIPWLFVFPLMILFWGVGTFIASRRYS